MLKAQSKEHNTYLVKSRRQSNAPVHLNSFLGHGGYVLINIFPLLAPALNVCYAPCFVLVEHSVCHEPISVLTNILTLLG